MPRWYAGVTCAIRGVMRCDRDCEADDFFFCAPNTGEAINTAAAKLVINRRARTLGRARRTFDSSLQPVADAPLETVLTKNQNGSRASTLIDARQQSATVIIMPSR